jgi:hypothetical protein
MKVKVFTDGFEGHVRRSLDRTRKGARRGERLEPEKIITFGDPMMMFELMTVQRLRLFQTARKKKLSISALAVELGRNRGVGYAGCEQAEAIRPDSPARGDQSLVTESCRS